MEVQKKTYLARIFCLGTIIFFLDHLISSLELLTIHGLIWILYNKIITCWGRLERYSAVRSSGCSSREPGLSSKYPHGGSQLSTTLVPRPPMVPDTHCAWINVETQHMNNLFWKQIIILSVIELTFYMNKPDFESPFLRAHHNRKSVLGTKKCPNGTNKVPIYSTPL